MYEIEIKEENMFLLFSFILFFIFLGYVLFKFYPEINKKNMQEKHTRKTSTYTPLRKRALQIRIEKKDRKTKNIEEVIGKESSESGIIQNIKAGNNKYLTNEDVDRMISRAYSHFEKYGDTSKFKMFLVGKYHLFPFLKDYFDFVGLKFSYNVKKSSLRITKLSLNYVSYIDYLKISKKAGFGIKTTKIEKIGSLKNGKKYN